MKMLGRWHTADGDYGFAIAESNDAQAVAKWSLAWNDLLSMDVRPALNDEDPGVGAIVTGAEEMP